jgi:hypothetical protein
MSSLYTRGIRVLLGLLGLSSIIIEIAVLSHEGVFNASNFFSFFTILSNLFAAIFLIYFGVTNNFSHKTQIIRGAVTLYMLMTGVIFAMLLAGLENVRLTAVPWDNLILHYIMPIVVVGDWVLSPPKKTLPRKVVALWIVFPILYVLYTLVRGSMVSWYPYPFLDPSGSSYAQVVGISLVISVFVLITAYALRFYTVVRLKR